jgi:hypothetical protein
VTRLVFLVGLLILLFHGPQLMADHVRQDEQGFGVIEGQVVDVDGTPVEGVTVTARYEGPFEGILPRSKSFADGRFRLESVIAGWVRLTTSKPEEGFPNTMWPGMVGPGDAEPPEVPVGAGETTRGVVVRLGPRCGKLKGTILDSSTGKPLLTARLKLTREDIPEVWLTLGPDEKGDFLFALPDLLYSLEVTAPHFKSWRSDNDVEQIPGQQIRVSQGEAMHLKIALEPDPQSP